MDIESDYTKSTPWLCTMIDTVIRRIGLLFSWLNTVLIIAILVQVILRYVFSRGMVMLEELQWHLYGAAIMIGLSYGIVMDSHIRVNVLSRRFSERTREKIEAIGILIFLLPLVVVIFLHSLDFLADSWRVNEGSNAPMGLCCRWIIKAFLPIGMILLMVSAVSRLIQMISRLNTKSRSGMEAKSDRSG